MRRKNVGVILALAVICSVILMSGCGVLGGPQPVQREMTLLEKAKLQSLAFMERYKSQYQDAESLGRLVTAGKASLAQVRVYRIKREVLIKVKPLIETFDALVAGGTVPGSGREQEINDLLNQLAAQVS